MNVADLLIEKYDLTDVKSLKDDEISIIWGEFTAGFDTLTTGYNSNYHALKSENLLSWDNLVTEVKHRNLSENGKYPKIISSENLEKNDEEDEIEIEVIETEEKSVIVPTDFFPSKKRFQCEFCQKTFSGQKKDLIEHIENIHLGIKYKCSECAKLFRRKTECRVHINFYHTNTNAKIEQIVQSPTVEKRRKIRSDDSTQKKRFECEFCLKTSDRNSDLIRHINSFHFGHRFKCSLCDKLYLNQSRCREHIENFHAGTNAKIIKAIITTKNSEKNPEIFAAEPDNLTNRLNGSFIKGCMKMLNLFFNKILAKKQWPTNIIFTSMKNFFIG